MPWCVGALFVVVRHTGDSGIAGQSRICNDRRMQQESPYIWTATVKVKRAGFRGYSFIDDRPAPYRPAPRYTTPAAAALALGRLTAALEDDPDIRVIQGYLTRDTSVSR